MTTRLAPRRTPLALLPILLLLVLGAAPSARAQSTGTLLVTVRRADSTPVHGAFVRSGRFGAATDRDGVARVDLPSRLAVVRVSHPGFLPRRFDITILPDVSQRFELTLDPLPAGSVPHAGRAAGAPLAEALTATLVGGEALDRRALAHPTDLTRVLDGVAGIDVQSHASPLDPVRFWPEGVPGRYTAVLVDGLPAAGGSPGSFDLLQFSPLEFEQVEWVRGPATALYGPSVPGSLVNLVPRRPVTDEVRLGINQSSEKGGDLMLWAGRRHSPALSASVYTDFHQQRLVDSDDDGWGEFPRAIRFAIRPRVYWDHPNGDGASLSAGFLTEERTGGFLLVNTGDDIYREERRVRRFDGSFSARRTIGDQGSLRLRVATVLQSVGHRFDEIRERDRRSTVMAEASWLGVLGRAQLVAGAGYYRDALRQQDFPAFDYTHEYPGVFGSVTVAATGRLTAALAARCDDHNLHGTQCNPRLDLFVRPAPDTELRVYGATGYSAPVPLTGNAETLGVRAFFPVAVRAERTAAAGFDLRWRRDRVTVDAALAATRVGNPVRVVPIPGDPAARLRLINLDEPTRVLSADVGVGYTSGPWIIGGSYGLRTGSEGLDDDSDRRPLSVVPRHQLGASLGWDPGLGTAATARLRYYGSRQVVDSPVRTTTPTFAILDGLITQRSGRATLYLSAENLLDVKFGGYEPVFLDLPALGGRRTPTPWAPLRGRVLSLGAMIEWRR